MSIVIDCIFIFDSILITNDIFNQEGVYKGRLSENAVTGSVETFYKKWGMCPVRCVVVAGREHLGVIGWACFRTLVNHRLVADY